MRSALPDRAPRRWPIPVAAAATVLLLGSTASQAVVLYQGALGTTPLAQGWTALVLAPATQAVAGGMVTLDTTALNALQAGYSRALPAVDSQAGFTLSFTSQLAVESHSASTDRAGFSVILLDSAHRGIEIGFWTDQVWAQSAGFTHAESASFDTTARTDYRLTLQHDGYMLSAGATQLLSGSLRDYAAAGPAQVYGQSNFVFLGDDTQSAKARVSIATVSAAAVPEPAAWMLLLLGGGLPLLARRHLAAPRRA